MAIFVNDCCLLPDPKKDELDVQRNICKTDVPNDSSYCLRVASRMDVASVLVVVVVALPEVGDHDNNTEASGDEEE